MKDLLVFPHLGLGDLLVCNGLIRTLSKTAKCWVMVRPRNAETARFMWRDNHNIELIVLTGNFEEQEDRARSFFDYAAKNGKKIIGLGAWGSKPFDIENWDVEMYRQAGVDWKDRWNSFRVDRQESREFELPGKKYIFVHEDKERGFAIDPTKLPKNRKIVRPEPRPSKNGGEPNLFDWWDTIEHAEEIHVIDSAFLCMIDSLPFLNAKRLVFHQYARPDGKPPHTVKDWERIK
jgi:hypothetical protein